MSQLIPAVMLVVIAGCGNPPDAEFVLSERTRGLDREAQKPIAITLEEDFGTPQDLVAWLRFPLNYGRHEGSVIKDEEEKIIPKAHQFLADFGDAQPADLKSGTPLMWLSGIYKGQTVPLRNYDSENRLVSLQQGLETAPAVGDQFVIVGDVLQNGRKLYMTHCMHCHGVSGDGVGPTAPFLNPRPRDYRLGLFKFTSTKATFKAHSDDLERIVKYGIPGTYMPSFLLLEKDEMEAIIEYVRFLAIRGEMEKKLVDELESDYSKEVMKKRTKSGESREEILEELASFFEEDYPDIIDYAATDLAEVWSAANEEGNLILPKLPRVADTAESRERGRKLYLSNDTKCVTCHGPTGRGNGSATKDFWKKKGTNETYAERGLHDDWGNKMKPRDLTRGIYRGGRRPIDIYRRIYAGIKGTPMPGFGTVLKKDEQIWDLVNYVMSLPFSKQAKTNSGHQHGKKMASSTKK